MALVEISEIGIVWVCLVRVAEIVDFSDDYVVAAFSTVGQETRTGGDVVIFSNFKIGEAFDVKMFEPGLERMTWKEAVNVGSD